MFDTVVTIVGNAITMPEWRRIEKSGALVTHFKVASNSRRYDRAADRWVDGDSLRVRVNCWRRLAEGVAASVRVGDPVIVRGRMYTRDWTTEDGQRRVMYELDAAAVGHDLSRGQARFERTRLNVSTSAVDDAEVGGDGVPSGSVSAGSAAINARSRARGEDFANDNAGASFDTDDPDDDPVDPQEPRASFVEASENVANAVVGRLRRPIVAAGRLATTATNAELALAAA